MVDLDKDYYEELRLAMQVSGDIVSPSATVSSSILALLIPLCQITPVRGRHVGSS